MDRTTGTLFLALLAVAAEAATVGVVAVVVMARTRRWARVVADVVRSEALGLAAVVAAVATAGSLWLSEGAGFVPCELCWFQRICMYPLAVMLTVAAVRRDPGVRPAAGVLAGVGLALSAWHVALQRWPGLGADTCDPTNPCTLVWVRHFGYLTIPAMAASGFALIGVLVAVARPSNRPADHRRPPQEPSA